MSATIHVIGDANIAVFNPICAAATPSIVAPCVVSNAVFIAVIALDTFVTAVYAAIPVAKAPIPIATPSTAVLCSPKKLMPSFIPSYISDNAGIASLVIP